MPILVLARAMPMVRTNRLMLDFLLREDVLDEGADL